MHVKWIAIASIAACALLPATLLAQGQAPTGNAENGAKLYVRCVSCHSMNPADQRMGPTLKGVIGRGSGQLAGYDYSPAMKAAKLTWTAETLDEFMANPDDFVPDNKMFAPSVRNASDRADIIAYLTANP